MHQPPRNPLKQTYKQSCIRFLPFRLVMASVAALLILLGKNSLPYGEVSCIEDQVIDLFTDTTDYLNDNSWIGILLLTVSNLLLDGQIIVISLYWFFKIESFRLPFNIAILCTLKMVITGLYETREIPGCFKYTSPIPSILNGDVFRHDYFFSAQTGFLLIAALEWFEIGMNKMGWVTVASLTYLASVMLVLRQNFFMDIFTGFVAAHLIFRLTRKYQNQIHRLLMAPYNMIKNKFK